MLPGDSNQAGKLIEKMDAVWKIATFGWLFSAMTESYREYRWQSIAKLHIKRLAILCQPIIRPRK